MPRVTPDDARRIAAVVEAAEGKQYAPMRQAQGSDVYAQPQQLFKVRVTGEDPVVGDSGQEYYPAWVQTENDQVCEWIDSYECWAVDPNRASVGAGIWHAQESGSYLGLPALTVILGGPAGATGSGSITTGDVGGVPSYPLTSELLFDPDDGFRTSPLSQVTQLNGAINSSVTTVVVVSGASIGNGATIQVHDEQMLVTAGGGTTSLTVTRGYGGTTAAAHADTSYVYVLNGLVRVDILDASLTQKGIVSRGPQSFAGRKWLHDNAIVGNITEPERRALLWFGHANDDDESQTEFFYPTYEQSLIRDEPFVGEAVDSARVISISSGAGTDRSGGILAGLGILAAEIQLAGYAGGGSSPRPAIYFHGRDGAHGGKIRAETWVATDSSGDALGITGLFTGPIDWIYLVSGWVCGIGAGGISGSGSGGGGPGGSPTVDQETTDICQTDTTITITGSGFTSPANSNTVMFNLGAVGDVTSVAGTSSIVVTFTTNPTSLGALTAIVFNANGSSTPAVQVGTVIDCTLIYRSSAGASSIAGGLLTLTGVTLAAGDVLLVVVGQVAVDATFATTGTWDGHALSSAAVEVGIGNTTSVQILYYVETGATAGTGNAVITADGSAGALGLLVAAVIVHNLPLTGTVDAVAVNRGLATTPDTGASGVTAVADEYAQAAFLLTGSVSESWGGSFSSGGQDVTLVLSGVTYKLLEGYRILGATGSVDASLTNAPITSWTGALRTFS